MRTIETQIEFYSDILENDITLDLKVSFEVTNTGGGDVDEEETLQAQFLPSDVSILTNVRFSVRVEFFDKFDNVVEEITDIINEEINN